MCPMSMVTWGYAERIMIIIIRTRHRLFVARTGILMSQEVLPFLNKFAEILKHVFRQINFRKLKKKT